MALAVSLSTVGVAQTFESSYDSLIDSAVLRQILNEELEEQGSGGLFKYQDKLAARPDSLEYLFFEPGVVTLNVDRSAKSALESLEASGAGEEITGYRVGVFFSNRANSRAEANKVVERCGTEFADIATSLIYDNPYFKVHAGYATTNEEAVILLNRLQKVFPKAYIIREKMEPKNLIIERTYN